MIIILIYYSNNSIIQQAVIFSVLIPEIAVLFCRSRDTKLIGCKIPGNDRI